MPDCSEPREDLLDSDLVYDSGAREHGRWLGYVEDDSGIVTYESGAQALRPAYLIMPVCPHLIALTDGCWKCERYGIQRSIT